MSTEPNERMGLLDRAKSYAANLFGTTRSRVDLLQADVEHRLFRMLAMIVWALVAIVCLSFGLTLAMLTIIFGLGLPLKYALGIPALVFLAVGAFAAIMLRVKKASKFDRAKYSKQARP